MTEDDSHLPEGRDYPEDFETSDIRQEFCPTELGGPWYTEVKRSDMPSVYHVARQAIRFAYNSLGSDAPGAQRRIPEPGALKLRWTLSRDIREREYVMIFTYLVPASASIREEGQLAGYAPAAVNWEKTGWVSDDVNPRRYVARVRMLAYPALSAEKSKCFYFFPEAALQMAEPTIGVDRDDLLRLTASRAKGRQRSQSIGEKLGSWIPWGSASTSTTTQSKQVDKMTDDDGSDMSVSDSDSEDERRKQRRKKKKQQEKKDKRKSNGEPATKKRKIGEILDD